MRPQDIVVGKTYINRGKGRTTRKVLAIGNNLRPVVRWSADRVHPVNMPGVLYYQEGQQHVLYLDSFAAWAGRELQMQEERK